MTALIFRRLLFSLPVLFIVVTLTFFLVRSAPGNPFSTEKKIPKEIMEQLETQYDLHGPISHQYAQYMWKVVHGDLSLSTQYRNRANSPRLHDSRFGGILPRTSLRHHLRRMGGHPA
jgi:oligopeptide transport system permease protein